MSNEKGLSLIEVLLIIAIIGVTVILLANIPNAMNLITRSRHTSLAREIATKQIEDKRAVNYINLANGSSNISDSRMSQLPQGSGTILIEDCDLSVCTNSEAIKTITVTVNWLNNSKPQTLTLTTFIGQGGLQ
ncbi:hypothetical protein HYS94_02570 [Candidatus Daviesbacteria bacterium]|nr:hypothetical protein [Candidatus Daviesbacteria bacterium]